MKTRSMCAALLGVALILPGATSGLAAAQAHDKAFWRAIAADKYRVPAGASLPALVGELSDDLGSPDSELRDEIAYSTLTSWIYQQHLVDARTVSELVRRWTTNLGDHVGEVDSDSVFRRSYSALILSVVVAGDNASPSLADESVRHLLDAALAYDAAEKDVRGFVPGKGWAHSAAHTADLIKFLARSRVVTPADQRRILDAISAKMTTANAVFVFGEDERMARAVLSVVKRADFDLDGFRAWVTASTPKFPAAASLSLPTLAAFQNLKNLLAKLEVLVAMDDAKSVAETSALESIRTALKSAY